MSISSHCPMLFVTRWGNVSQNTKEETENDRHARTGDGLSGPQTRHYKNVVLNIFKGESYTCSDIYLYLCRHLLHFRNYYKMKEIIDFLRDLSCNNNKEWFTANKQRYQEVLSHWHEFVSSHPHEKNVWITS